MNDEKGTLPQKKAPFDFLMGINMTENKPSREIKVLLFFQIYKRKGNIQYPDTL